MKHIAHVVDEAHYSGRELSAHVGVSGRWSRQFDGPFGVFVLEQDLFVTDFDNHRVQVFSLHGDFLRLWGAEGKGQGQFNDPVSITVSTEEVSVADQSRIQVFSYAGEYLRSFGSEGNGQGQFDLVNGMALFRQKLFLTDFNNHRIEVFR